MVVGMPLAEAEMLATARRRGQAGVRFLPASPEEDLMALWRLAGWCQRYSPVAGVEGPDSLLLEISGSAHLYGGEQRLCGRFVRAAGRWGLVARVAVADTTGAAWAVARFGKDQVTVVSPEQQEAVLRPLPVAALRLSPSILEKLSKLAVRQVGQLQQLPRASLASRFGTDVARRLDQALGYRAEPVEPVRLPEVIEVEEEFEYATSDRRSLEAVLSRLLEQIAERLAVVQQGVQQLEVRLLHVEPEEETRFTVGMVRSGRVAAHLLELVRTRLEQVSLTAEVRGIQVEVKRAAPLESRQNRLFDTAGDAEGPRELARLLDRLSSRLGKERVVYPVLCAEAQPELAVRWRPVLDGGGASAGAACSRAEFPQMKQWPMAARPLFLRAEPVPVEVLCAVPDGPPARMRWNNRLQAIARWWGPERIETGWWREQPIRRDYYRVETASGQRFWLFRRIGQGDWFLHGEFE